MTNPPSWLPSVSNPRYDERPSGMRLRGSSPPELFPFADFMNALDAEPPPGYRFSKASAGVEHARGRRLTWSVSWIKDEHAEQLYQDNQAKRLSRFEIQT